MKGVECAREEARPLRGLGAWSLRNILKFRSSEIDSSAFLRKKCKYLGMFQLIQLYINCRKTDALAAIYIA